MIRCVSVGCSNMPTDNGGIYYSNSERSKALKLSQSTNMQITSTSCAYQSANNSSPIHFNNPQAHSSPIEGKKSKNFVLLQSFDSFDAKSTLGINETSRTLHKSTNILSTKSSPVARSMHNISNKASTNVYTGSLYSHHNATFDIDQDENVEIQLHVLDQDGSNKNKVEDIQTFNAKAVSDNSEITYDISALNEHTKYDDTFLNKTDSSDIFQMGLNLKMFPKYVMPYLNSLKLDFLQLVNNCSASNKPDKQIIRGSKTVNDIVKNIENILKLNMNNNIETETKINKRSTVKFLTVDFNALNDLNRKLEGVYRRIESVGLTMNDKTKKNQSIHEKYATNLSAQHYNSYLELDRSNLFHTDLEPLEPIGDGTDDDISSAEDKSLDLSQRVREINESIDLSPPSKENNAVSNKINTQSQERSLENYSLDNLVNLQDKEITTPDINLQATEFIAGESTSVNNSNSNNTHVKIYNGNQEEKTGNRYFLRTCPKSTEHFIAPSTRPTPVKRKSSRAKTNRNADVFVCKGTGKKKVVLQYKVHSVFKANSNELIKKISPESMDCENNIKHNATSIDISNVIPKQIDKPCRCGIFPSQVPPSWSDSLHKDIHQNLHKIQFKSQTAIDVISKINDNGFLYDIINVTTNSNNDKYLSSTLKNINQFINLEFNNSKKTVKNFKYHSIYMAVNPNSEIIGYLETEPLKNACIFQNNELSDNLTAVKFGVLKLWVVVKYRNNGVASNLLNQFCYGKNLSINDIAFAYHGGQGNSFIKKYFKNNSVLIY